MVLPSENLQAALAGGLGRLDLSSDMFICAEARVATAQSATAIKANFLIILFLLRAFSSQQSAVSQFRTKSGLLNAECLNDEGCFAKNYTYIPVTICPWPSSTKSRKNSSTSNSAWACLADASLSLWTWSPTRWPS